MKLTGLVPMIAVGDMPASVEFYRRLGFAVDKKDDQRGWALLSQNNCRLMLDESVNQPGNTSRSFVEYMYSKNIREHHQHLRKTGLDIPDLDITFYGMTEFRIDDPDGNGLWIGPRMP